MLKGLQLGSPQRSQVSTLASEPPTSPSRYKIQLLSDKFKNVSNGQDKDQYEKKGVLEDKLKLIEDYVQSQRPKDDTRFKNLKDNVLKLQENINDEKQDKDVLHYHEYQQQNYAKREKDLLSVQSSIIASMEAERTNKINYDNKTVKFAEDKFNSIGFTNQRTSQSNEEKVQERLIQVRNQIQGINNQIDGERRSREESAEALQYAVQQEIDAFSTQLMVERKIREETQNKVFGMIEDIHQQLQYDIQREKKEREQTTDALLKLLESACIKIDRNFKG